MLNRETAYEILTEMTQSESLLRHARTVELVMRALAKHFGEDEEQFGLTGLLHDADYEKFPDRHPAVIVEKLTEMGEPENRPCHRRPLYPMECSKKYVDGQMHHCCG